MYARVCVYINEFIYTYLYLILVSLCILSIAINYFLCYNLITVLSRPILPLSLMHLLNCLFSTLQCSALTQFRYVPSCSVLFWRSLLSFCIYVLSRTLSKQSSLQTCALCSPGTNRRSRVGIQAKVQWIWWTDSVCVGEREIGSWRVSSCGCERKNELAIVI